jgi:UDPglucose 6-dehydrogenase
MRNSNKYKQMAVHRPGVHFEILSNPEFLAAGTAMKDLMHPDRVLIGSSTTASGRRAAEALASVYAAWVPRSRIITTNVWSSELAKLVANSMLAQRISSINSISAICEKTGADVDEIAASIGCDPRIGDKFLKAGIGFGGSCFKKDILSLVYLAESLGLEEVGEYWRQVIKMNEYQRDRFSQRVVKSLNNTLVGKKVALLGYAFKANTSDTRESPALEIIKTLLQEGPKEIAVFDPCCNPVVVKDEIRMLLKGQDAIKEDGGPIVIYDNAYEACAASNAVLITTEFDEFRNTTATPAVSATSAKNTSIRPLFKNTKSKDPRPFERLEPTETEILALHKFLLRSQANVVDGDPLQRYNVEPDCTEDCPDCGLVRKGYSTAGNSDEYKPKEKLDWNKISYHMAKPKWVFDGKGLIDVKEMNKLGVRVESVGRQGRV